VRVIPNASVKCEVQDALFLEAFGMTAKKSSSLLRKNFSLPTVCRVVLKRYMMNNIIISIDLKLIYIYIYNICRFKEIIHLS